VSETSIDFDGQRGALIRFDREGRYCYSMPGADRHVDDELLNRRNTERFRRPSLPRLGVTSIVRGRHWRLKWLQVP